MLAYVLPLLALALVAIGLGALLADRLMPMHRGKPSTVLPVQPAATELDRWVAPLLAAQPGRSGAVLLHDGLDAFALRAVSARSAGRSLDLQYYIWRDDLCGRLLALEVWRAAERGVRVRMLLDDMNAHGLDRQLLRLDAHPNIEVRLYNPFRNRAGLRRLVETVVRALRVNHRMHNKAWIADGRLAVVGGRNIGEAYFGAAVDSNFRDLDVMLMGPAVAQAESIFDAFWNDPAAVPVTGLGSVAAAGLHALLASLDQQCADPRVQTYLQRVHAAPGVRDFMAGQVSPCWVEALQVMSDPPQKWRRDDRAGWLVQRLVALIAGARTEALLISPYFVPGRRGSAALVQLERQGTRVAVVTNSLAANDVPAVHSGYARYRKPLLAGGVRLNELRAQGKTASAGLLGSGGASLHTKAVVVDGERGFIGSFNLDPRSADLNTEMGVLFDHAGLAAAVKAEFQRLAGPALSYGVTLGADGQLVWLDGASEPPRRRRREPDASRARRLLARVLAWLPIESQL
ncbi:MAG TPA: phospholipase D family protein [Rhodanobacteraceae bacterium]|nr:phospholipase D family protein [Rhodanobacteraceae bacterium]